MELVQRKLEGGQFAEAIELLEKLRRYQPDEMVVLYNLGMALSDTGQFDKAEQILRNAVKVAPDHVNARVALGVVSGTAKDATPRPFRSFGKRSLKILRIRGRIGTLADA